jgi:hypothetical protein
VLVVWCELFSTFVFAWCVCVFVVLFLVSFFVFFSGVFRRIWGNRVGVYSYLVAGLGVLDFVFFQKRGYFWWQDFFFGGVWVVLACSGVWAVQFGMCIVCGRWLDWGFPAVCRVGGGGRVACLGFALRASRLRSTTQRHQTCGMLYTERQLFYLKPRERERREPHK